MPQELSDRATAILQLVSEGHTYDQIIQHYPDLTFKHIFQAAEEALLLLKGENDGVAPRDPAEVRKKYPRHMKAWKDGEEAEVRTLFASGKSIEDIARKFQRKPGAIRSRLIWLGILKPPEYPSRR